MYMHGYVSIYNIGLQFTQFAFCYQFVRVYIAQLILLALAHVSHLPSLNLESGKFLCLNFHLCHVVQSLDCIMEILFINREMSFYRVLYSSYYKRK